MRAPDDAIDHRHGMHAVFAEERHDLGEDQFIVANIVIFGKPAAELRRFALRLRNDANGDLASSPIVGSVDENAMALLDSRGSRPWFSFSTIFRPAILLLYLFSAKLHGHSARTPPRFIDYVRLQELHEIPLGFMSSPKVI
jgi:hypothetical protein